MGVFERFFGRKGEGPAEPAKPVANPDLKNPLSLLVLFGGPLSFDGAGLTRALRGYHAEMAGAVCEIAPETAAQGTPLGLAGWGRHVVQLVGFSAPAPAQVVEDCVAPAHYKPELKRQAREHKAHVILYYAGYEESPYEQYVALTAVAGALAEQGALLIANEVARTSFPAQALRRSAASSDEVIMELLRGQLLLLLYCGFVKCHVQDVPGVWMRTYGCERLGLPDLAYHAESHAQGQNTFDIFANVLGYVLNSGAELGAGHTMQVGETTFMKLRAPTQDEGFLDSEGELFVAEMIPADQINRPR
jgi:hypothetical protein